MEAGSGGLPLGRPLLPPGPPDEIKLQPHTKPPNPTSGKLKRNDPLCFTVTLTMLYCYARCATEGDGSRHPHSQRRTGHYVRRQCPGRS